MSRFKPKTLYFYERQRLEKHTVTMDCMIEVVKHEPYGTRFRCRGEDHSHDVYGYGKMKEAKVEEIRQTKLRIGDEKRWLEKLTGEPDAEE